MTAPHISNLPTPPSRSQSPSTFSTDADAFLGALPTFQSEANSQADYLDALAATVDADAVAAAASAVDAENSATIAGAYANYTGAYNAGTTYQIGDSVSYSSNLFVALTVNTGVTPVNGANWAQVGGSASAVDIQEFTSSGTWTKPDGAKFTIVEVLGAGGGGGSGSLTTGTYRGGGAGGGGGSRVIRYFNATSLGATETVTIGSGGAGGVARTVTDNNGLDGDTGGNSTFGSWATAYGGNGGGRGYYTSGQRSYAGTGAGNGVDNQAIGWIFTSSAYGYGNGVGGMGASAYQQGNITSDATARGGSSEYGGAAGGTVSEVAGNYWTGNGGGSLYAGAGGGAGGSYLSTTATNPRAGGAHGTVAVGTGGAAGLSQTTPTAGTAGSLTAGRFAGSGGGGGGAAGSGAGAVGGAGARGSGGGGGGGGRTTSSGAGGAGGNGYARVITFI